MSASPTPESAATTVSGIGAALFGLGAVVMVLFPFAIPILVLTAAVLAPIAIVGVVVALPLAAVAGIVLVVRSIGRLARGSRRREPALP